MSTRTVKQALEHAEEQRQYASDSLADMSFIIEDFILLADELNRLRGYGCKHPERESYVAFVSEHAARIVWEPRGMMFNANTPVEIDPAVKDSLIHFPQPDGTCIRYNV